MINRRKFSYVTEEGKSSGRLFGTLPYRQKLRTEGHLTLYTPFGLEDNSPLGSFRDTGLGYSNVIEFIDGKNNEKLGKINYSYTNFKNGGGGYYEWPFYLSVNNEWKRGLLLSTKYYTSIAEGQYQLQREERNTYEFKTPSVPAVDMYVRNSFIPAPGTVLPPFYSSEFYQNNENGYRIPLIRFYRKQYDNEIDSRFSLHFYDTYYKRYYLIGGKYNLIKNEIVEYNGNDSIKTTYLNGYSTKHRLLATQRKISQNEETEIKYTYVADKVLNDASINALFNKNRISILEKVEVSRDQEKVEQKLYKYKNWGNNWVDLEQVEESKGTGISYVNQKILFRDTSNGNIIEVEDLGTKTVYLYGYNRQLLIAKIANASKEQVASALGVTVANLITINETKFTQLNNLRTNSTLQEALITTYEHQPLVGITKITDSKGQKSLYEYDESNRLKTIKDDKGNILEKYEYNFKN